MDHRRFYPGRTSVQTILIMTLAGCASGRMDASEILGESSVPNERTVAEAPPEIVCSLASKERVRGCTIFHLDCDGQADMAVVCSDRPAPAPLEMIPEPFEDRE